MCGASKSAAPGRMACRRRSKFLFRSNPLHPECLGRDCLGLHIPPGLTRNGFTGELENGPEKSRLKRLSEKVPKDPLESIVGILEPKRLPNGRLLGGVFGVRCKSENGALVCTITPFSPSGVSAWGHVFGHFSGSLSGTLLFPPRPHPVGVSWANMVPKGAQMGGTLFTRAPLLGTFLAKYDFQIC